MNQDQPIRPANIGNIVAINQGKRPLVMEDADPSPLTADAVAKAIDNGAIVVDGRAEAAFGGGHVPGAFNFQLSSPEFEQRVGWVTPQDVPIVLVMENDTDARRAAHALGFVGLLGRVEGYLRGGMRAWINAGHGVTTIPQHSVHELQRNLDNGGGMKVLDVREIAEWNAGHIENAMHMSFKILGDRLEEVAIEPRDRISVVCAGGLRSSTACSVLLRNGFQHLYNVTGGMSAWKAAKLPMVDAVGCAL